MTRQLNRGTRVKGFVRRIIQMMRETCRACGQKISPASSWCPWCGEPVNQSVPWRPVLIIGGAILLIGLLVLFLVLTGNG
jgi:hypothetical protein